MLSSERHRPALLRTDGNAKCHVPRLARRLFATPASAAEKMTVVLDWFLNPDHATLVVARDRGIASPRRGLDVELIAPADPPPHRASSPPVE